MNHSAYYLQACLILNFLLCSMCSASGAGLDIFLQNGGLYVPATFMSEWVTPKDVLLLDTAASNAKLRPHLQRVENAAKCKDSLTIDSLERFFALHIRFPDVEEIVFSGSKQEETFLSIVRDVRFKEISPLKLTTLNLIAYSNMADEDLGRVITRCSNLKAITLTENKRVSGTAFTASTLDSLTSLVAHMCNITDEGLLAIITNCKNLSDLSLNRSTQNVTQSTFKGQLLPELQELKITQSGIIVDLSAITQCCPKLKVLHLNNLNKVTADNFAYQEASALEELELIYSNLTDEVVVSAFTGFSLNLKKLSLAFNGKLTKDAFLSVRIPNLIFLDIRKLMKLSNADILEIIRFFPKLKVVSVGKDSTQTAELTAALVRMKIEVTTCLALTDEALLLD